MRRVNFDIAANQNVLGLLWLFYNQWTWTYYCVKKRPTLPECQRMTYLDINRNCRWLYYVQSFWFQWSFFNRSTVANKKRYNTEWSYLVPWNYNNSNYYGGDHHHHRSAKWPTEMYIRWTKKNKTVSLYGNSQMQMNRSSVLMWICISKKSFLFFCHGHGLGLNWTDDGDERVGDGC